jgi:hypothetical protein
MEKSTLAEYRLLHQRASFFTATSLFFDADDGDQTPLELAGERVGITDSGEPYSLPSVMPGTAQAEERVRTLLKTAKARHGLFRGRSRAPLVAVLVAALALFAAGLGYCMNAARPLSAPPAEAAPEKPLVPAVFETLSAMADIILQADGTLLRWTYDENAVPPIHAAVEGPEAERLIEASGGIPHIVLSGISNVRYAGEKARYDAVFLFRAGDYLLPRPRVPENGETAIAALSAARAGIMRAGASVSSETIPMPENGYAAAIRFSGGRDAAAGAFSVLEKELPENGARITQMSVSYEEGRFEITLAFVPAGQESDGQLALGWMETVMDAFGAAAPPPSLPPRPAPVQAPRNDTEGYVKIGVIYDNDGVPHVYYRTKEGRIVAEPELWE